MSGCPLLPWYLRLLGARVGRGCQLASGNLSLPSMLRIEDDVSVGYGAHLQTFRVVGNRLHIAPVVLGEHAFIGANAVVEPGAVLGAGSGLAEMSAATAGQRIPAGQYWSGSPSQRCAQTDPLIAALRSHTNRPQTQADTGRIRRCMAVRRAAATALPHAVPRAR